MANVFLSYAHEDRPKAKAIAQALSTRGWIVWWDRTIPPGKTFDEVIEAALDGAQCVVVLWSKTSVASHWVKAEAAEGMRRQILVPALLDNVRIPLEFRRVQAADLSAWNGDQSRAEFKRLLQSISTLAPTGVPPAEKAPPKDPPAQPVFDSFEQTIVHDRTPAPRAERPGPYRIQWIAAAVVLAVVLAGILSWRYLVTNEDPGQAATDIRLLVTRPGPAAGQLKDKPADGARPSPVLDQRPTAATEPVSAGEALSETTAPTARPPDAAPSRSRSSGAPQNVEVPPLVGLGLAEARDRLGRRGFKVGQVSRQTTDSFDLDTVVAQEPAAGSRPALGSPISLVVATPAHVAVPMLVGLSLSQAQVALTAAGLQLGTLARKLDENVKEDNVTGQTPRPGTRIEAGKVVDLDVGQAAVRVPGVVGLALPDGSDMLRKARLEPGKLTLREAAGSKPGLILSQSVRQGTLVAIGTSIDFEVER